MNKIKNVNKMTCNELDETNKVLENELKRRKLNLINLNKFKGKEHLSPTSKAKTSASNSIYKDSSTTQNKNNYSKRTEIDNSFNFLKKENFLIENSNDISILNSHMNTKQSNLKTNKEKSIPGKKEYFSAFEDFKREKENIMSTFKRELSENRSQNRHSRDEQAFNNYSYKERLNQSAVYLSKRKNTKDLIPFKFNKNSDLDETKQMKHCLDRLKLCQRIHLPKEKNYFISEKNLKLLENAINEKECDINILRSLLNMAKDDIDLYKNRYESINIYIDEILMEKSNLIEDLVKISDEKNKIKENYDEYVDKYNKMLTFLKKIESIITTISKLKLSYEEFVENYSDKDTKYNLQRKFFVDCVRIEEGEKITSYIKLPEKADFLKKFQELIDLATNEELRVYRKFFEKKKIINSNFFFKEKTFGSKFYNITGEDINPDLTSIDFYFLKIKISFNNNFIMKIYNKFIFDN
jgi:hypothetical protein